MVKKMETPNEKINKINIPQVWPGTKEIIPAEPEEVKEQRRTTEAKALFLKYLKESMGVISLAAAQTNINRGTYYLWYDKDPEFAATVGDILREQRDEVEDKLLLAIMRSEPWAVTLYLKARHPAYIPKQANFNHDLPANKTLEDLIDDYESQQSDANRNAAQDTQQARRASAVQIQPGPAVLLEAPNPAKPDTQSAAARPQ